MFKNKRTGRTLTQDLNQIARDIKHLVEKELPEEAESKLGEITSESFRQEKYIGGKSGKWKARKGEKRVKRKERRGILVQEGNLAAAPQTFSGKKKAGIRIADDGRKNGVMVYGPVHNEGKKSGRGKGFKMEKRQFMPIQGEENRSVSKHLQKHSDKRINQIMNK